MKHIVLAFAILVPGCLYVRESDLQTWKSVDVHELETHPLFSTMPRNVTPLSNGDELWDYTNCRTNTNPVICNKVYNTVICSGGNQVTSCCHNQFYVRQNKVQYYRPIGNCYTNCSTRPHSSCSE